MKRKRDYLFLRPGSKFWQLKLQSPDGRTEQSLRTTDRAEAEVLALPLIAAHKAKLLARDPDRPRFASFWRNELEPGREHVGPDGGRIIATERELIHLDHNGAIVKTTPNGAPDFDLIGEPLNLRTIRRATVEFNRGQLRARVRDDDDALIDLYLKQANLTGYPEKEARDTWALFRELCPGVKLKDATRDHGRKLVAHFTAQRLKSATIQHKVARLTAAVNFAIKEGKLSFNPFSSIIPKTKDAERRKPFDDDDMRVIKSNLDKLTPADRLMVTILATTGMRLGETFHIKGESKERGVRYVMVGSKTEQSLRRVPLPAKLLPLLPQIKGPLFPDDDGHCASSRLNRWLRKTCEITDPHKVIHSFRHRAQDRLRAAECPAEVRWNILGHEERTVAAGYGEGYAVPVLKRWIDNIGM